jgi:hypothetical protein
VTAYISRAVGPTRAARIVRYLKSAQVPMRAVGSGTFFSGLPAHLAMLVKLAEEEQRAQKT